MASMVDVPGGPVTRQQPLMERTKPPDARTRSASLGKSGLWSTLSRCASSSRSRIERPERPLKRACGAAGLRPSTARVSPQLATSRVVPRSRAQSTVVPSVSTLRVASSRKSVSTCLNADALRSTQQHSAALRCTQMHSDACTQMHSDARRCTRMHSDALRAHQRVLVDLFERQREGARDRLRRYCRKVQRGWRCGGREGLRRVWRRREGGRRRSGRRRRRGRRRSGRRRRDMWRCGGRQRAVCGRGRVVLQRAPKLSDQRSLGRCLRRRLRRRRLMRQHACAHHGASTSARIESVIKPCRSVMVSIVVEGSDLVRLGCSDRA